MTTIRYARSGVIAAALLMSATMAHAQATRTWVSGVGDDVNPCSRTAPCKTFAGAISKTAAKGEISVLDPGGFGAVTITKSITIDGGGIGGSLTSAGQNGIIINSGEASAQVILRNLSINGVGTGTNGIRAINGNLAALYVERCDIFNYTGLGIDFQPTTAAFLFVSESAIQRNLGGGVRVLTPAAPVAGSVRRLVMTNSVLEGNAFGLKVDSALVNGSSMATVRGSTASGSGTFGYHAVGTGTFIVLHQSAATACQTGVQADIGATVLLLDSATVLHSVADTGGAGTVTRSNNSFPP